MQVLSELMHALSTDDPRRHEILRTLERALDCLDTNDIAATAGAARAVRRRCPGTPGQRRAHTSSVRLATRTSTPPGFGPNAKPSARPPEPSPMSRRWRRNTPSSYSPARRPSNTPGSRRSIPSYIKRIQRAVGQSAVDSGRRHVGRSRRQPPRRRVPGPAARRRVSGSSWTNSATTARASGCPTRSAIRPPSRSWRAWPGCDGS